MKLWHGLIIGVALLLAAQAFAAGDRPGRPVRQKPNPNLMGKVLEVKQNPPQLRLGLYLLAASPDAPGKVPDDMAKLAAELAAQATALEKQRKHAMAARLRQKVDELLRWRQVEYTVSPTPRQPVNIMALRRSTFENLALGTSLRLQASVAEVVPETEIPKSVTVMKDALQVAGKLPPSVRRMVVPGQRITFYDIVGEVVGVKPLRVRTLNNTVVQVATPPEFGVLQLTSITPREIPQGQEVMVQADVKPDLTIQRILRVVVLFTKLESPPMLADEIIR